MLFCPCSHPRIKNKLSDFFKFFFLNLANLSEWPQIIHDTHKLFPPNPKLELSAG